MRGSNALGRVCRIEKWPRDCVSTVRPSTASAFSACIHSRGVAGRWLSRYRKGRYCPIQLKTYRPTMIFSAGFWSTSWVVYPIPNWVYTPNRSNSSARHSRLRISYRSSKRCVWDHEQMRETQLMLGLDGDSYRYQRGHEAIFRVSLTLGIV